MTKTKRKAKGQPNRLTLKLVVIAVMFFILLISVLSVMGPSFGNVFSNVMYTFEVTATP